MGEEACLNLFGLLPKRGSSLKRNTREVHYVKERTAVGWLATSRYWTDWGGERRLASYRLSRFDL